jgi:hypothetical protein
MAVVDEYDGQSAARAMSIQDHYNLYVAFVAYDDTHYGSVGRFNTIDMTMTDIWHDEFGRAPYGQNCLAETGGYVYIGLGYNYIYTNYVAKITKGTMLTYDTWQWSPPEGYDPMYDHYAGIAIQGDYLYLQQHAQVDLNYRNGFILTWDDMTYVGDYDGPAFGRTLLASDGLLYVGGLWNYAPQAYVQQLLGGGESLSLTATGVSNAPHVYSVTGDGTTARFFVDGILKDSQAFSSDLAAGEGNDWTWMSDGVPWLNDRGR